MSYSKVVASFLIITALVGSLLVFVWNKNKIAIADSVSAYLKPKIVEKYKATPTPAPTIKPWSMPTEEQKKWYLATGAILGYQNNEGYLLKTLIPRPELKRLLEDWWSITDHESAVMTLDWLRYQGHRMQFEDLVEVLVDSTDNYEGNFELAKKEFMKEANKLGETSPFIVDWSWEHRDLVNKESLIAWDYMRLTNVVRWSYSMGYITEEEAWRYLVPTGQELQSNFASWEDAANNYVLGREFWQWSTDQNQTRKSIKMLLSNPTSPWIEIPFKLPL